MKYLTACRTRSSAVRNSPLRTFSLTACSSSGLSSTLAVMLVLSSNSTRIDHGCHGSALLLVMLRRQARDHRQILRGGYIACDRIRRHNLPQQAAHDLAAAGLGERVGEADLLRLGEAANLVRHPLCAGLRPVRGDSKCPFSA